jgi:hypothetical protein
VYEAKAVGVGGRQLSGLSFGKRCLKQTGHMLGRWSRDGRVHRPLPSGFVDSPRRQIGFGDGWLSGGTGGALWSATIA